MEKLIIGFSLWGTQSRYTTGAVRNAELAPRIYPGWICRFYVDDTVPGDILDRLAALDHVEIVKMPRAEDWTACSWRFQPAAEDDVDALISRDTDSRLNERERAAVDDLVGPFDGGDELRALWDEYEAGESPEARFVRACDKLDMALQAEVYADRHGVDTEEFVRSAWARLEGADLTHLVRAPGPR